MIRFSCPICSREYLLPDALSHLPLLCKECGNFLAVPDPQPEDQPLHPSRDRQGADNAPESVEQTDLLPAPLRSRLGKTEQSDNAPEPAEQTDLLPASSRSRLDKAGCFLPRIADAAAYLLLAILGMLLGEIVVRKSTGEIIRTSTSAPKFPPADLLLWLACVAAFVLLYVWLGKRGWSIGELLRRRATSGYTV